MGSVDALAALAATSAFAQSNVNLYGNLDQTLYHGANNGKSVNATNSNGGTTSLWGMMGKEDLGGGLNAIFDLKAEITLATGQTASSTTAVNTANTTNNTSNYLASNQQATLFNRGAFVGLSSAQFGTIKIGRQNDAVWEQEGRFNNTGINSFGWNNLTAAATDFRAPSIAFDGTYAGSAFNGQKLTGSPFGYSDAKDYNPTAAGTIAFVAGVSYETPTFNGVKAKVVVGPKSSYDKSSGTWNRNSGSLTYDNGPIAIAAGLSFINGSDGNTAAKVGFVAGSYVYNQFKFSAAQQKTTYSGVWANPNSAVTAGYGDNMTVNALGVGYTTGPWEYNLGYTTLTDNTDSTYKTTQTGLSARYNFSKRTSVYAALGHGSNTGAANFQGLVYGGAPLSASTGAASTANVLLTGIRHQF